jgi:hypothetical protein
VQVSRVGTDADRSSMLVVNPTTTLHIACNLLVS